MSFYKHNDKYYIIRRDIPLHNFSDKNGVIDLVVLNNGLFDNSIREKSNALRKKPSWFRNKCSGEACLTSLESFSKVSMAFPKSLSSCAVRNSVFSMHNTVLSLMYSRKLSRFSWMNLFSKFGMMVILFCLSTESWLSTSKVRMLSTSLPKNSIRYGLSFENENTSRIPPRTENFTCIVHQCHVWITDGRN